MKRYQEYEFEGVVIRVPSEYNKTCDKYITDLPDFEEEPMYTPSGKPLVAAVQDRCSIISENGDETDCGSCEFYKPNHPGDLIGVCDNPQMKKQIF